METKEELKEYIDDHIRLSTDSAIQTLTNLMGKVLVMLDNQKKEFDNHKKEIAVVVEEQIKKTVNGKIDRLTEMVNKLEPVKKKYEEEIKADEVHDKDRKRFIKLAGIMTAIGILLTGAKIFIQTLIK